MTKETNCIPVRKLPVCAALHTIVDWQHPLLAGANLRSRSAAGLLAVWRRAQGYVYLFDRADLPAVLRSLPPADLQAGRDGLRELRSGGRLQRGEKPLVPRAPDGTLRWDCYTPQDQEYVCVVNRFGWLTALAVAARASGRVEDAEAIFALLDDWIRQNPIPADRIGGTGGNLWYKPWGPLQAGVRVKFWVLALHVLWDSPALTPERFGRYVLTLREHALWLSQVSSRLWPRADHNHYIMEMEGLMNASLLPWLKESGAFRNAAAFNLLRCVHTQVLEDGVHVERAPSYHNGCIQWLALPLLLCQLNGVAIPQKVLDRIASMLEFNLLLRAPEGWVHRFEDAFSGCDGYQSEMLLAKLFNRRLPLPGLRPAGILPYVRNAAQWTTRQERRWRLAGFFPFGGFAVSRTGWEPTASMVAVKLDGHGGGHAHDDYLSFCFSWKGRTIVDERGTLAYDNTRKAVACKLAAAHNVVLIGGRDMLDPGSPTQYWDKRSPLISVTETFFENNRDGRTVTGGRVSWPDGAWWMREIEFLPRRGLCIRDRIETPRPEVVRIQFHLSSTCVQQTGAGGIRTQDPGRPNVAVTCFGEPPVIVSTAATEIYGHQPALPATRLVFTTRPITAGSWETEIRGLDPA
jgi:hypothetical protein